ncbi:MAG TPA: tetratricopeptide repeat protein, partial [Candidatus Angelobacter sp.]|nr:tetratricopeptide repeat protein [Candidatus Angelobacter sp.]
MKEAQKLNAENLELAASFRRLALLEWALGKTVKAFEADSQALTLAKKIAPNSYEVVFALQILAMIEQQRNDLDLADQYGLQALAIAEKIDPHGEVFGDNLIDMGSLADRKGDLDRAEVYYSRALPLENQRGLAMSLSGLGMVASERGDLANGEKYYRQALSIEQEISSGNDDDVADSLTALAIMAWVQGDLRTAEHHLLAALKIRKKDSWADSNTVTTRLWLGIVAQELGNLDVAERYYRWVIRTQGGLLAGNIFVAVAFDGLGDMEWKRGHLRAAETNFRRAVSIQEKMSPDSGELAASLGRLGGVFKDAGALSKAEEYYRRALAIRQKISPGNIEHAEFLAALASIMRKKEQPEAAVSLYRQALDALENQTARLGGDNNVRAIFRAKHADYYGDYAGLLLFLGKPDQAFNVFERSRARTLLEMMAAAHVDVRKGVDPSLLGREHSLRDDINAKSERRIRLMGEKHTDEVVKAVDKKIADLLAQYQEIEGQIRATSPGYAALTQPQPLTAKEVQTQLLDPNTLLLEYTLGEERSYVFAVTPDSLQAFELPKRAELEKAARHVYSLLTARNLTVKSETASQKQTRLARAEVEYPHAAAELSKMILGPVAAQLQNKRLLIVSDGALAYIPFSTLPEPYGANTSASAISATAEPLVVNHEIVNLPSASVLSVLRQQELGRMPAPNAVVVLADPVFDRSDARVSAHKTTLPLTASAHNASQMRAGPTSLLESPSSTGLLTRSAADIGLSRNGELSLPRLHFSRKEADAILAVTPAGLGKKAVDF